MVISQYVCAFDEEAMISTYLVLVYNDAFQLFVVAVVAVAVFDDLVDVEVSESSAGCELLTVRRLAHAWRASDYDVRVRAHRELLVLLNGADCGGCVASKEILR